MLTKESLLPESVLESPNFFTLICNYFTDIENFNITKINNVFFDNNKTLSFTLLLVLDQHIDYIENKQCKVYLVKYDDNATDYAAYVKIAQISLDPDTNKQRMDYSDRELPPGPNGEVLPYARQTFIIPLKNFQTLGPGIYGIIIADGITNDMFSKIYSSQKFTVIPTSMGRIK